MKNLKELRTFGKVLLIIFTLIACGLVSMLFFTWIFDLNINTADNHVLTSVTLSGILAVGSAGWVFLESFID